jgi:hypothetical protein
MCESSASSNSNSTFSAPLQLESGKQSSKRRHDLGHFSDSKGNDKQKHPNKTIPIHINDPEQFEEMFKEKSMTIQY